MPKNSTLFLDHILCQVYHYFVFVMLWRGVWLGFLISGERVDSSEEAEDLLFLLLKN